MTAATQPTPATGDVRPAPWRFAHYEVHARLGEGGFGVVHEAWDLRLDRAVAIKFLRDGTSLPSMTRLLSEARAAAPLRHRAFVQVIEIIESDGRCGLVMELVCGSTFQKAFAGEAMPAPRALRLVRQCAEALAHAHRAGLVHGDIKPSNLMVEDADEVRILDFGLARRIDQDTAQHDSGHAEAAGTIAYMAPELLFGATADVRSDIYSLGMVLFELLSGERPFATLRGALLAHAILHGDDEVVPAAKSSGDGNAMALVAKMIARDSSQRMADMHDVVIAIDGLLGRRQRSEHVRDELVHAVPRPSLRLVLLAALGVLVLGAGAWWLHGRDKTPGQAPGVAVTSLAKDLAQAERLLRFPEVTGNIDAAIDLLKTMLAQQPRHAAAAAELAIAYCMKYAGDSRDDSWLMRADVAAQLALDSDDQLALAHAARGWTDEFLGKTDAAAAAYARARVLEPDNFHALLGHARLLARRQQFTDAEDLLQQAIARYPDERLFQDALGTMHYQRADYVAAEQAFRRSIALNPDNVYAYGNLNAALLRQDRIDEALAVLQQGLKVRPDGRLYSNLGTALFAKGRYLEAVDAFERAVSPEHGSPNDYLKWGNLADALRWVPGREADARAAYTRTLELAQVLLARAPDDATLLSRAAVYHAMLGHAEAARQHLTRALAVAPDDADLRFRATLVGEILGDRDAALVHAQRAVALGFPRRRLDSEPELIALRRDRRYLSDNKE